MSQRLLIIRGLPGSGKSTFANNIALSNDIVVEADQFHMIDGIYQYRSERAAYAHQWCLSETAYYLNQGNSVFVANTFITARSVIPYYELAKDFDVDFEIKFMTENYGSVHDVPKDVLESMTEHMEDFDTQDIINRYQYWNEFDQCEE